MTRIHPSPCQVSLPTIIGASPLLGHALEERASIRAGQDAGLAADVAAGTALDLRSAGQRRSFVCAPLDVMMSRDAAGTPQFHVLELNGTGIGGITNLPEDVVLAMLASLEEIAAEIASGDAVVLLAISGKENDQNPRRNRLMHEKLLFADAILRGLERRHGVGRVVAQVAERAPDLSDGPTVVLGYMKDLLGAIECDSGGRLRYAGRPIRAILNDRFCTNLADRMSGAFGRGRTLPINACFLAGSDKSFAYALFNEFVREHRPRLVPTRNDYEVASTERELVAAVHRRLDAGRPTVIKPRGTGVGHGIEFFLNAHASRREVVHKIRRSVELTASYYGLRGGAFPYTVCDFIESCTIAPGHALAGHRFELRVVVYRDGPRLKAFPMAVKVASLPYDRNAPAPGSLINNVTASAAGGRRGSDFLLPLANPQTLELVGLSRAELRTLCSICTGYVAHVIDRLDEDPARFGLCPTPLEACA